MSLSCLLTYMLSIMCVCSTSIETSVLSVYKAVFGLTTEYNPADATGGMFKHFTFDKVSKESTFLTGKVSLLWVVNKLYVCFLLCNLLL